MSADLAVIVPVYRNPDLIAILEQNFRDRATEIHALSGTIIFINDSPDFPETEAALLRAQTVLAGRNLAVHIIANPENLGFVAAANVGLKEAVKRRAHALLLNSDVILHAGCLTEMMRVMDCDPMIGLVNPRSNDATICSLPLEGDQRGADNAEAVRRFKLLSPLLPEWHFVPTGVGFCLLIRNVLLQEFGLLDESYSPGYNEENDFCMRLNRCGYRVALANRAFAYHASSQSFGQDKSSEYDKRNRPKLLGRYPEYETTVNEYLRSQEYLFETGLSAITKRVGSVLTVALDYTHVRADHTGTAEHAVLLMYALARSSARDFHLVVIVDPHVMQYHRLNWICPELEFVPPERAECYDVVIKSAQPFRWDALVQLSRWGLYNFVIMLDTIAWDCAYIRNEELHAVWRIAGRTLDGILFISQFSQEQFNRRFPRFDGLEYLPVQGHEAYQKAVLLSCTELDYLQDPRVVPEPVAVPSAKDLDLLPEEDFILVVGNNFDHKAVVPSLERLARRFPQIRFVALGKESQEQGNVTVIKSGGLSHELIDALYKQARLVVFPSHYEGFGFPIAHGLARGSIVLARWSELNFELARHWTGKKGALFLFKDPQDMVHLISEIMARTPAVSNRGVLDCYPEDKPVWDWSEHARATISFINDVVARDPDLKQRSRRMAVLDMLNLVSVREQKIAELAVRLNNKENQRAALERELRSRTG